MPYLCFSDLDFLGWSSPLICLSQYLFSVMRPWPRWVAEFKIFLPKKLVDWISNGVANYSQEMSSELQFSYI